VISVVSGAEGTGWFHVVASPRRPEGDLVRIHPNNAVANDRCEPIEATRSRPEYVVAEAVELRAVSRILEPPRRPAVDDSLAEMGASGQ